MNYAPKSNSKRSRFCSISCGLQVKFTRQNMNIVRINTFLKFSENLRGQKMN